MVKDKVRRTQVSKSVECENFPSVLCRYWFGDRVSVYCWLPSSPFCRWGRWLCNQVGGFVKTLKTPGKARDPGKSWNDDWWHDACPTTIFQDGFGKPVSECLHSAFYWSQRWWSWWWQLELQDVQSSSPNVTIDKRTPSFFTGWMHLAVKKSCTRFPKASPVGGVREIQLNLEKSPQKIGILNIICRSLPAW